MLFEIDRSAFANSDPLVAEPPTLLVELTSGEPPLCVDDAMPRDIGLVGKGAHDAPDRLRRMGRTHFLRHLSVRHHLAGRNIPQVGPPPLLEGPGPALWCGIPGLQGGRDEAGEALAHVLPLLIAGDVEGKAAPLG